MAKYTLLINKNTGIRSIYNSETKTKISESLDPILYNTLRKKALINLHKRQENEILSDLCGTSARSARLDMGL